MKYAVLDGALVVNVILATPEFAAGIGAVAIPDEFGIGDSLVDGEWVKAEEPEPDLPSGDMVNAERDRRIAAGFSFNGVHYDFDSRAKANISGAAQLAFMAIVAGAEPGDLFWNGGATPFMWIAADNSMVSMDAQTVVAFGRTAALHEQSHIFAARALKDMEPVPADYAADVHWP